MRTPSPFTRRFLLLMTAVNTPIAALAATTTPAPQNTYILGDSIAFGLHQVGLEAKLSDKLGGQTRISYDIGRSITSGGAQINKTALESVVIDADFIAKANHIVVVLGTNMVEVSFQDSLKLLVQKLKATAPHARLYWVDIAATIAPHAANWSARNKIIYDNASPLGYSVISRYKAIFGMTADPLNINPGAVFPGLAPEPGFGGIGNVHGGDAVLAKAVWNALPAPTLLPAKSGK